MLQLKHNIWTAWNELRKKTIGGMKEDTKTSYMQPSYNQ